MPADQAATEMMARAQTRHIRTPPILNFDSAGTQYVVARAYQYCAWQLNPSIPEVARPWD
jgi:hypothetical protein